MSFLLLLPDTSKNMHWRASSEEYAKDLAIRESWEKGGFAFHKPQGSTQSMLGGLPKRGYFIVQGAPQYKEGDIITFPDRRGSNTTHRVAATRPGQVYPKGDNNLVGDGWIDHDRVIGKIRKFITW